MTVYPVVFTYEEIVKGRGFLAGVLARGRALMVHEDDEWWMYGVEPGVLAEGGETFDEARLLFRETFKEILFDLAADAPDFESFKKATEKTLYSVNAPMEELWRGAVEKVRADATIEEPLQQLPRIAAEAPAKFTVVEIVQPAEATADNRTDEYLLVDSLAPAA
jgi:hypothetical protein